MSTLDIRGITKSFGTTQTLKGIDLTLEQGEFLVLLGASGCGKSTLLGMISGLGTPTSGDIVLDGRSLNGVHPKDRDIAMVFQSYALYPNLSVARNIGFGLEMRGAPRAAREAAVQDTARVLKIDHLLDRKPGDLSGGQRQRVAIGRALVRKPRLFLFDEPLSNLDAKLRMEMRSELKRLHQTLGVTVVYVTHDQIEAMTLASRIAVMQGGRIEQLGTPEDIYDRPATRFVAEFMGAPPMNMLPATPVPGGLALDGTDAVLPCTSAAPLLIGLRPEALKLAPAAGAMAVSGTVDLVELTGPERIVTVDLGARTIAATLPADQRVGRGQPVTLYTDPARASAFDPDSGRRVTLAPVVTG